MVRGNRAGRHGPTLIGAIGVALWATETTLITYTTAIPPLQTVAVAFAFAALLSPILWLVSGTPPWAAFQQPPRVWLLTVGSLTGYHASIYYATQKAPAAAAALLQGTTPLMIVIGSAVLPGERLRWWHVVGACLGFCGVVMLIENGGQAKATGPNPVFYLSLIGVAAGLWGLYSVASRRLPEVPSSTLGISTQPAPSCLPAPIWRWRPGLRRALWNGPPWPPSESCPWASPSISGTMASSTGTSRRSAPSPMWSRSSARCCVALCRRCAGVEFALVRDLGDRRRLVGQRQPLEYRLER